MSLNTILATAPLTTTNYILKATGTTIGNSLIWDNGTNVGIGNTNTSYTLDVSGSLRATTSAYFATSSGSVGIGTSSPSQLLELSNGGNDLYLRITRGAQYGTFGLNSTGIQIASAGTDPLYFSTNGIERMRIRSDGAISLGSGYGAANSFTYYPIYSAGQPGFALKSSTAADLIAFNGNTKELFLGNLTGGATTLSTDASGNVIRTPSDINLKTNIQDLEYGLQTIMQLRPIIHNWKESIDTEEKSINMGEGKSIGFIAQEVELLVPEIVCGDEYKSIDYPKMVAILTKAIQELSKQNEELSNRLIKLESK